MVKCSGAGSLTTPGEVMDQVENTAMHCWDNAVAELFFKTIKTELIYQNTFYTRDQARQQIFEYIESCYNGIRRHSTLGYKTPVQYERLNNVA